MATSFQTPISTYDGFNMDPAYMTPSYMAAFRPGFVPGRPGQNPYEVRMSTAQAFSVMAGGNDSADIDPFAQQAAAAGTVSNLPGDVVATGFSNIAAPILGFAAAHYALNTTGIANAIADKALPFAGRMVGRGAGVVAGLGARAAVAGGSAALGSGFASRVPGGMSVLKTAGAFGRAGAAVGAAAAPFLAPLGVLSAGALATEGILASTVDPYTATRQGTLAVQANSMNQYIGGPGAAMTGSLGVSATRANEIATKATQIGAQDWALDSEDVNKLTDAGMRAGLFSNTGDLDLQKMETGIKSMISTIKTVVALGAAADEMGAVDLMAKMKGAGLNNFNDMAVVASQLSGSAAVAGVSVEQLMTTVGNRSQMQATQRGMLPIIGQVQAASAYAGIQNAHRAGLLSSGQMAALGGVEGMTASTMDNAYNAMDSDMGRMAMQTGRGFGANGLETMVLAGQQYASNPLGYEGDWALNRGAYMSEAMRTNTAHGITAGSLLRNMEMNAPMAFNDDGTIEISKLWPAAKEMGMSESDFRTFAETIRMNQNSQGQFRLKDALKAQSRRRFMSKMESHNLSFINNDVIGGMQIGWNEFKADTISAGASVSTPITEAASGISDWWQEWSAEASGIVTPNNQSIQLTETGSEYVIDGFSNDNVTQNLIKMANGKGKKAKEAKDLLRRARKNNISKEEISKRLWALDVKRGVSGEIGREKIDILKQATNDIYDGLSFDRQVGSSDREILDFRRKRLGMMDSGARDMTINGGYSEINEFDHLSDEQIQVLSKKFSGILNKEDALKLYDDTINDDVAKLIKAERSGSISKEDKNKLEIKRAQAIALGITIEDTLDLGPRAARNQRHGVLNNLVEKSHKYITSEYNEAEVRARLEDYIETRKDNGKLDRSLDTKEISSEALNAVHQKGLARFMSSLNPEEQNAELAAHVSAAAAGMNGTNDYAIVVEGQLKDIMASNNQQLSSNTINLAENTKALTALRDRMYTDNAGYMEKGWDFITGDGG